uniref:Uncharacterized protein n=1 Tax=Acrobeloides nanus TaxID=290746 RepID=A0A914D5Q7_9BILA
MAISSQIVLFVVFVGFLSAMPNNEVKKREAKEHDIIRTISSCKRHPVLASMVTEAWREFLTSYKNLLSKFQFPGEHKVIMTYAFNPKETNLKVGSEGNEKEFNLSLATEPSGCLQVFEEEEIITTSPTVPVQ